MAVWNVDLSVRLTVVADTPEDAVKFAATTVAEGEDGPITLADAAATVTPNRPDPFNEPDVWAWTAEQFGDLVAEAEDARLQDDEW